MTAATANSAAELVNRFALRPNDLVIEVGSGDGSFLRLLRERGLRVLGVESDRRRAVAAFCNGIDTLSGDFDPAVAATIRKRYGPARLVIVRPNHTSEAMAAAYSCTTADGTVLAGTDEFRHRAA